MIIMVSLTLLQYGYERTSTPILQIILQFTEHDILESRYM